MTSGVGKCCFAMSTSADKGEITVYDLLDSNKEIPICAHSFPIKIMEFNQGGTWLASTSNKV